VFEVIRMCASGLDLRTDLSGLDGELPDAVEVAAYRIVQIADEQPRRATSRRAAPHPRIGDLTERKREMVAWVATGRSNDEIAEALVISPATVRTHVSRAMIKLDVRDRAQLVVFAIQSGLRVEDRA
jgi:DNA-binding CsgD family transcriptional regulator